MQQLCIFTCTFIITGPPESPQSLNIKSITATSTTLTWTSGHHGGSIQTFDVEMKSKSALDFVVIKRDVADPGHGNIVNVNINDLKEKSFYTFRVVAKNQYNGTSLTYSKEISIETPGILTYTEHCFNVNA
jgi:S-formylglutathione hydrolase FrmB